jgi:hypothetical protein
MGTAGFYALAVPKFTALSKGQKLIHAAARHGLTGFVKVSVLQRSQS